MKRTVQVTGNYVIEIDESNHTLCELRPAVENDDGSVTKSRWEVIGYYSNIAHALIKVKSLLLLDGQSIGVVDHCMDLVSSADKVCFDTLKTYMENYND